MLGQPFSCTSPTSTFTSHFVFSWNVHLLFFDSVSFVAAIRSCSNVTSCQARSSFQSYLERNQGNKVVGGGKQSSLSAVTPRNQQFSRHIYLTTSVEVFCCCFHFLYIYWKDLSIIFLLSLSRTSATSPDFCCSVFACSYETWQSLPGLADAVLCVLDFWSTLFMLAPLIPL